MKRTTCGACGSGDLDLILDLGSSPLADDFPATREAALAAPRFPLQLLVCTSCWLVQLGEVVPDELLWGGDYGFHTGASPSSVAYFEGYADWLGKRGLLPGPGELAVEIASNDGTLLRHLGREGGRAVGVEPAKGPAAAAVEQGLNTWVVPFGQDTASAVLDMHGPAKLVVANNVLAHVADLPDFLAGVRALLAPGGVFVAEVQYLPDLLLGNQFDHVYHEHRSFFALGPLILAAGRHRLFVRSVHRMPAQGGSIRVTLVPQGGQPVDHTLGHLLDIESRWTNRVASYLGVQARADVLRDRLLDLVTAEAAAGRRVVGVAASAKSCTLLNWCGIGPGLVEQVHDFTPGKAGRWTPGTGIPITTDPLPPGRDTTALVLAHNYLPGILRREAGFLSEGGRFVVPIPQPVVI